MEQQAPGFLAKLLGALIGTVLLIAGFMFSLLAFGVIALLAAIIGGWLWWKTRALRREMRDQMQAMSEAMDGGRPRESSSEIIIEGEFEREPHHAPYPSTHGNSGNLTHTDMPAAPDEKNHLG